MCREGMIGCEIRLLSSSIFFVGVFNGFSGVDDGLKIFCIFHMMMTCLVWLPVPHWSPCCAGALWCSWTLLTSLLDVKEMSQLDQLHLNLVKLMCRCTILWINLTSVHLIVLPSWVVLLLGLLPGKNSAWEPSFLSTKPTTCRSPLCAHPCWS